MVLHVVPNDPDQMCLQTGHQQHSRVLDGPGSISDLASIIAAVSRRHIIYRQYSRKRCVVADLNRGVVLLGPLGRWVQRHVVPQPGYVEGLVALAGSAHQLGSHALRYTVFEIKWRYPRRY